MPSWRCGRASMLSYPAGDRIRAQAECRPGRDGSRDGQVGPLSPSVTARIFRSFGREGGRNFHAGRRADLMDGSHDRVPRTPLRRPRTTPPHASAGPPPAWAPPTSHNAAVKLRRPRSRSRSQCAERSEKCCAPVTERGGPMCALRIAPDTTVTELDLPATSAHSV